MRSPPEYRHHGRRPANRGITAERPGDNGEEPTQIQASRTALLVDLKTARTLKPRISNGWDAEEIYSGTRGRLRIGIQGVQWA